MSQVRPISIPDALSISLNNYYDLLKMQVGGLVADEYLQLKLVADPVDIDDAKYRFFSMYELLNRSDLAIEPMPVSGTIMTAADRLHQVYGRFLQRLRGYVVRNELSAEEQEQIDTLDLSMDRNKKKRGEYALEERLRWREWAEAMGYEIGDEIRYQQWTAAYGNSAQISALMSEFKRLLFDRKTILDREYADPEDREIVDAEFEFESEAMRIRYPTGHDYMYPGYESWTLQYLAGLTAVSTATFDDRRAMTWNVSIERMKTIVAGAFDASWDQTTGASSSITTDWGASGSVGYGPFSASASASEHVSIQEDFKKMTGIGLSAKAAYKVQIIYPGWFRSSLFRHKRVKDNIRDFQDIFGEQGTLRYYPTHLILIRGFSTSFKSSQNWSYDYERKFNASAGGGFSVLGISFGSKGKYGKHVEEHKIDKQNTELKISDGEDTLRFVGYVVKKNKVWDDGHGPGFGGIASPIDLPGDAATAIQSSI